MISTILTVISSVCSVTATLIAARLIFNVQYLTEYHSLEKSLIVAYFALHMSKYSIQNYWYRVDGSYLCLG